MRDPNRKVADLEREVAELRRYRKIVEGQNWIAKKTGELSALIWLGPGLVHAIHKWMEARRTSGAFPELESVNVIAAVMRRVLRIGLVAVLIAIIPAGISVVHILLLQSQLVQTRSQTTELVRFQRSTEIKRALAEIESNIFDKPYGDTGLSLGEFMNHEAFYQRCDMPETPEHTAVDDLTYFIYPYAGLISELYLLDTRVIDPLDDTQSENWITQHGEEVTADMYWRSLQMSEVVRALAECRPINGNPNYGRPLIRLLYWSLERTDHLRYMIAATDVKYRYDVAAEMLKMSATLETEGVPTVSITIENHGDRRFAFVDVRCLIGLNVNDLASKIERVSPLEIGETKEITITFPEVIIGQDMEVTENCRFHSLKYDQGAVTTYDFFPPSQR